MSISALSGRRTAAAAFTAALLAAGLTACGDGSGDGAREAGGTSDATGAGETVDSSAVEHVHGLGVDPSDPDAVYVATHDGLLRYQADEGITRVGDLRSDFMGFTVGPGGDFLASGHPAPTEDGPSALGLIRSTDRGKTWQPVALSGEADLHTMDAGESSVVGYDAATGLLRVSDDGRTFADVEAGSGYIDIAVDPASRDTIYGTTAEAALVVSSDGGRTFDAVADAPPLVLVDVAPDGVLVGIGIDGVVHSSDDGMEWKARTGSADAGLQAFTAASEGTVWMLDSRGLVRSDDGGDTFAVADGW